MVTGKQVPKPVSGKPTQTKEEAKTDNSEVKKPKGFFASHQNEILVGGFISVIFLLLLYVAYLFVSLYFERVDEVKVLNRKLDAAVMLACKVSYRKDPNKVSFQKVENSEGRTVTVLKCEPEPIIEKEQE